VDAAPFDIYKISARAVKNRVKTLKAQGLIDNDATQTDEDCARLIYELATKLPIGEELSPWRYVPTREKYTRIYTSVRPYDKRNYKDPQVDKWMSRLIAFDKLPEFDQLILSNGKKRTPDYAVARVLPFAMAFDEEFTESRNGYEFILGLYSDGYPSFYRRCTVSLMQRVAKELYERANGVKTGSGKNGNILNSDITPQIRKEAWKEARKIIRHLYSLSK
jgi:hypothetical protein